MRPLHGSSDLTRPAPGGVDVSSEAAETAEAVPTTGPPPANGSPSHGSRPIGTARWSDPHGRRPAPRATRPRWSSDGPEPGTTGRSPAWWSTTTLTSAAFVAGMLAGPELVDVVLEAAYVKAYRSAPRLDPDTSVAGWLCRSTYSACLDEIRRQQRRREAADARDGSRASAAAARRSPRTDTG